MITPAINDGCSGAPLRQAGGSGNELPVIKQADGVENQAPVVKPAPPKAVSVPLAPLGVDASALPARGTAAAMAALTGDQRSEREVAQQFATSLDILVQQSKRVAGDPMGALIERLGREFPPQLHRMALLDVVGAVARTAVASGCEIADIDAMLDRVFELHTSCKLSSDQCFDVIHYILSTLAMIAPPADRATLEQALAGKIQVVDVPGSSYNATPFAAELGINVMLGAQPGLIETRYLGGKYLIGRRSVVHDLGFAYAQGVRLVCSLLEKLPPNFETDAASLGMRIARCPTPDFNVPFMHNAVAAVVAMHEAIAAGEGVLIHCHAGRGRSGMLGACLLTSFGVPPDVAIKVVREQRPGAIETRKQELFVNDFANYWKEHVS